MNRCLLFMFALFLVSNCYFVSEVEAVWFNTTWNYTKPVDVNISENVTDYKLLINITNKTNAQNDCSDMRFTLEDNVTELYYWEEECNISREYALIWVNVTLDTYNGTQIMYWYGNTSAVTSQSDGEATFDFFDNFPGSSLNTSKWQGYTAGASVSNSILTFDGTGSWQYLYNNEQSPSMRVVFKSKFETTDVYSAFIGYYNGVADGHTEMFNQGALRTQGDGGGTNTTTGWQWTDTSNYYRSEIIHISGASVNITHDYVNDAWVENEVFTTSKNISFGSFSAANSVFVDYVFTPKYIATEPTYSIGAEQTEPSGDDVEFIVYINSPVDNYNTTDTTPDFNFTVNGTETNYSCELFLNDTGYGTVGWTDYLSILSGLPSISNTNTRLENFNNNGIPTLIYGKSGGTVDAYNWTGSTWQEDSVFASGLHVDGTSMGTPETTILNISGDTYAIMCGYDAYGIGTIVCNGFLYNGSGWEPNSSINSSIEFDLFSTYSMDMFTINNTTYLLNSHFDSGYVIYGYNWTGSTWQEDNNINSSLTDASGIGLIVDVFDIGDMTYLIETSYQQKSYGYNWNGTSFITNSDIIGNIIPINSRNEYKTVFTINDSTYMLTNSNDSVSYILGKIWGVQNNTATIITANATVPDGTYNWYINCTANEITNSSETRSINIDSTPPQIEFVSPTYTNNSNITVNFTYVNWTVTETNQDTVIFNWNGSNSTVTDTFINKTNLEEGTYTYYVWINDTFGYENQTDVRTIKIDTILPTITVYSPENISYYDISEVNLNVSADEVIDTWWYELNSNGTNTTFTPNTTISIVDGQNNIIVWTNDTSGNENSSTVWFFVRNTTITVNYTSGDYLDFATTSYHGTFAATGQDDSTAGINITNDGNVNLSINITVNTSQEACMSFWISNDSTLDTATDYNVTDTMQNLITNLGINESIQLWTWMIFNQCTAGTLFWYMDYYDSYES